VKQCRAWSEIAMEAPAGRGRFDRRLLGPLFETGGIRTPLWPGAKQIAVPLTGGPARPTFASQITPALTFSRMRLIRHRYGQKVRRAGQRGVRKDSGLYDTSGMLRIPTRGEGGVQFKGSSRTFMIVKPEGGGTVFQRTGPGEITPVYVLRKPMRLRPRLHWISTAQQVAETWFPEEMEREVVNAIARAKGGGL
jgi:hypothetical protein